LLESRLFESWSPWPSQDFSWFYSMTASHIADQVSFAVVVVLQNDAIIVTQTYVLDY